IQLSANFEMRILLEIFEVTSTVALVSGIFLNLLLLLLIRRFSTKELGTYKYLLGIFTAYDTFLVIMHPISNPTFQKVIQSHTGFAIIQDNDLSNFVTLFCYGSSCNAVPFVLLNIHLLYRFWTIRSPYRIALFSDAKFIALMAITTASLQLAWFVACLFLARPEIADDVHYYFSLFRQEYDSERVDGEGILLLNYWREGRLCLRPFLLLLIADSVVVGSCSLAAALAALTYREIGRAQNISARIRDFQRSVLIAASAQVQYASLRIFRKCMIHSSITQTLTPVVCVYIPYFCNVTFSLVHVFSPTFSALSMVLLSLYPSIDAVVIVVLMKPYREGLLRMIGVQTRDLAKVAPAS
ncbi:hypothetical protein PENTCL1PPCAC_15196, partial [Pristionchus entomophagus]